MIQQAHQQPFPPNPQTMGCNQSSSSKYKPSSDKHSTPSNPSPSYTEYDRNLKQRTTPGPSKYSVSIPASWRLTEAESKEALHAMFTEFNIDVQGHMSREELTIMLRAVCKRANVDLGSPWTNKQITSVMDAFDADGNGSVEESELVDWILSGLGRSEAERKTFAKRTPISYKLDQFLTAVATTSIKYHESHRPISKGGRHKLPGANKQNSHKDTVQNIGLSKLEITDCLHGIFESYDDDANHNLDLEELQILVNEIINKGRVVLNSPYTRKDLNALMKAFDADGNGTVDETEFIDWLMKGMSQTEKDRRAFKNSGELAYKLDTFLTAVTHVCQDVHASKENVLLGDCNLNENQVRSALHALYDEFAIDNKHGTNNLTSIELQKLMNDVGSDVRGLRRRPGRSDADDGSSNQILTDKFTTNEIKQVIDIFDEDENGIVEEREFMNWVVSGIKQTNEDRAEFAKMSSIASKLDLFLLGVIAIIQEWHTNHDIEHENRMRHRENRMDRNEVMRRDSNDTNNIYTNRNSHTIDSWDHTFQDMEQNLKIESMTGADFHEALTDLSSNFNLKLQEIEQKMKNMQEMQETNATISNRYKNSTRKNNRSNRSPGSPMRTPEKATERISFLENKVAMLESQVGIENDLEHTVPYMPHAEEWKLKSPTDTRKMNTKKILKEAKQLQQPQWNTQDDDTDEDEEDDHHVVLLDSDDEEEDDNVHVPEDDDDDHHYVIHLDSLTF